MSYKEIDSRDEVGLKGNQNNNDKNNNKTS